jgi:hypothetical protein
MYKDLMPLGRLKYIHTAETVYSEPSGFDAQMVIKD